MRLDYLGVVVSNFIESKICRVLSRYLSLKIGENTDSYTV